ncbi:TldD/PmbA family protein [Sphaerisporangium krabiense]|uniref:TldD protein n=1 Tax=Sphaerisporangium krabiense TaxID=763782 RepID=A0A7W8Z9U1_9ACTN|nr:TldD/PmbA family protein [Sphaerisporangium krabiense]MBB5630147.1 TldD protein [Sphaerisporangium krabiense]
MIDPEAALRTAAAAAGPGRRAEVFAESWVLSRAVADRFGLRLAQRRREGTGLSLTTADGVHHRHLPYLDPSRLPALLADDPTSARPTGRHGGPAATAPYDLRPCDPGGTPPYNLRPGDPGRTPPYDLRPGDPADDRSSTTPLGGSPAVPASHGFAAVAEAGLATAEELSRMVALAADEVEAAFPGVVTARVTGEFVERATLVAREDGLLRHGTHRHLELRIHATARRDGVIARTLRVAGAEIRPAPPIAEGHRGQPVGGPLGGAPGDDVVRALARAAAEASVRDLDAVEPPLGEMPVVLAPGGPGALLHEVCGHGLEADVALLPGAAYGGLLGDLLSPAGLTLIDAPRAPLGAGLYDFDDEGEPAEEVALLEDGVLRSYLRDRRASAAAGLRPHGHGRRLSYAYPALPRMSCTYVAPGRSSPEEIIAATPYGLYVESIVSGETDMSSGRFSVRVTAGRLIENGKLTAPIREATLSGTGPGVLRDIDMIGDDLRFMPYGYQCNKLGQFPVTVSVGQPTLRVARMTVSGP